MSGNRNRRKFPVSAWLVAAFVGGIILVFIGLSFAQEVRRRIVLRQHVEELQQEISRREQRIADLRKLVEYLKTDAYAERAARAKLGYKRPNEKVVVVPGEQERVQGAETSKVPTRNKEKTSIPEQWWHLIFS